MRILGAVLIALLSCSCQTQLFAPRSLHLWAQRELAQATSFPYTTSKRVILGHRLAHNFTLLASDADHVVIDCGNGLRLKVKDPQYATSWAAITFQDADCDGYDDLRFTATFQDDAPPINVIFRFHPTEWEQFILPIH